jgi:transposase
MESTGVYHRLLAARAHAAGMRVYVLNARDVHFYAKAMGTRGKTDRVDAGVIARYVAEHHARLRPWRPAEPAHGRLEELVRRRGVLVTKRDAIRQTLRGCADLAPSLALMERAFDDLLGTLDAKVQGLIDADAALLTGQQRVASVIGFGPQGSSMLAVLLARLDFANADALVAYSGLDPRPNDSGNKRGKRRITKRGPAYLRRQVYMAGFSASHSKALKGLYQAMRAKGFATTEAFMILGRKLLRAAYSVWKTGQPFDPSKLMPKTA